MSPRKSSTSSGRPPTRRPRYLGVEVSGAFPAAPRLLEQALREALAREVHGPVPVRLVRTDGRRAIVEVPHQAAPAARRAWNEPTGGGVSPPAPFALRTVRTYGTLLKAKAWLSRRR